MLATSFLSVVCLAYISTVKMEAVRSSEISVNFHQTTRRHIPANIRLHSPRGVSLNPPPPPQNKSPLYEDL
jgi:hypothetical protein